MNFSLRHLTNSFGKINLNQTACFHLTPVANFRICSILQAEPPKAKKRMDPALIKAREDRARRRLERDIRKLERQGKKLKPIEEMTPEWKVLKEQDLRKRNIPKVNKEEEYAAIKFIKEWQSYRENQAKNEFLMLTKAVKAQERALKELKKDNHSLYMQAIQIDYSLIPYVRDGPSYTPPINEKEFEPPEGDYLDVTFLFDKK